MKRSLGRGQWKLPVQMRIRGRDSEVVQAVRAIAALSRCKSMSARTNAGVKQSLLAFAQIMQRGMS